MIITDATLGPQRGSRRTGLRPRTLEVFEGVGIIERILENGEQSMPILTTAPDGTVTRVGGRPKEFVYQPDVPYLARFSVSCAAT